MKKTLLILFQLLVSVGLLAWLFREPGFRADVIGILKMADPGWLIVASLTSGAGILLGFVRWGIFLHVVGISVSPWQIFRMGAVGLFFNHFLPGAIGGDAIKIGWLAARGTSAKDALLSVIMDRISGIGALVLCSVVFMGLRFEWLMRSPVVAAMNHLVIGYLVAVIALLTFSFVISAKGAVAWVPRRLPGHSTIVEFASTYSLFVQRWPLTLIASGISVLLLLAYFLTFYFCALALGVDVPVLDFMAFMPAVDLIAALPISLGGFGLREGAFVTLLGDLCGVPAAEAISVSFAGAVIPLLWGCLGLFLLPGYKRKP